MRMLKENAITMTDCEHCGEPMQGWALVNDARVCHPWFPGPGLPDCYRRVTVYRETLGALKTVRPLPDGITDLIDGWRDFLGIDFPAEVCMTHMRFIPCRAEDGTCRFSSREEDVNAVRDFQRD